MAKPDFPAGPWHRNIPPASHYPTIFAGRNKHIAYVASKSLTPKEAEGVIKLLHNSPEIYHLLRSIVIEADKNHGVLTDFPIELAKVVLNRIHREFTEVE